MSAPIHEDHSLGQYFWDDATCFDLAPLFTWFAYPTLVGCPHLAEYLWGQGRIVTILDIDDRFSHLPGFLHWDFQRPEPLPNQPDLILVDPPFNNVRLDRLFRALRVLAHNDQLVKLAIAWPPARRSALVGTFAYFGLEPTGYHPKYVSTDVDVELYANFDLLSYGVQAALPPPPIEAEHTSIPALHKR